MRSASEFRFEAAADENADSHRLRICARSSSISVISDDISVNLIPSVRLDAPWRRSRSFAPLASAPAPCWVAATFDVAALLTFEPRFCHGVRASSVSTTLPRSNRHGMGSSTTRARHTLCMITCTSNTCTSNTCTSNTCSSPRMAVRTSPMADRTPSPKNRTNSAFSADATAAGVSAAIPEPAPEVSRRRRSRPASLPATRPARVSANRSFKRVIGSATRLAIGPSNA
eukprot:6474570-Prymnesium_polylepis.2